MDVKIKRASIAGFPITFTDGPADWKSIGWEKTYKDGVLTVTVDMSSFATEFADTKKDFCQPASFLHPDRGYMRMLELAAQ